MTLSDEVEKLFIKHFAEEDKRKAMMYLKPRARKESHATTFFIGMNESQNYCSEKEKKTSRSNAVLTNW